NTLPAASTGGAVTCEPPLEPWPKPRRQATERLVGASELGASCCGLAPGSGQSATAWVGGRAKSTPFSASAGSSFWSSATIEMRSPSAVSGGGPLPLNGLKRLIVEQPPRP